VHRGAVGGVGVNGKAVTRTLLARGRDVLLWDVNEQRAQAAAAELKARLAGSREEALAADLVVTVTPGREILFEEGSLRPGQHASTSMTVALPSRKPTAPGLPQRRSPEAQRAAAFQDQLDRGVAAGRFRVVQVRADIASHATDALAVALKTQAISIDHALTAAVRQTAEDLGVEWANIETADRQGPGGPDWPLLIELVTQATNRVVDDLLKRRAQTLVLAWPGALARYSLAGALSRIVAGAEQGDAPAILLVVPSHADGTAPSINGRLPVPAPLPSQRPVMPDAWLANAHKAAETP
jgi:hypothetical protein